MTWRKGVLAGGLALILVGGGMFAVCVAWPGYFSHDSHLAFALDSFGPTMSDAKRRLIQRVPKTASVAATPGFFPARVRKARAASLDAVPPLQQFPEEIQYVFLDLFVLDQLLADSTRREPGGAFGRLLAQDGWCLVEAVDNLCVFKKSCEARDSLYEAVSSRSFPDEASYVIDETWALHGAEVDRRSAKPGGTIQVRLTWECLRQPAMDYGVAVRLVDADGVVVHQMFHQLGYGPLAANPHPGGSIDERLWILVPYWIRQETGSLSVKVKAFVRTARDADYLVSPSDARVPGALDTQEWLTISPGHS